MIQAKQRVRVYFNLHKQCLSVMDKKTRRVIAHVESIHLDDVKFVVSKAGLARVRREKRKSVIAFVEGDYLASDIQKNVHHVDWRSAYFNPYVVDSFVDQAAEPLEGASEVYITGKTVYAKDCRYAHRHAGCA